MSLRSWIQDRPHHLERLYAFALGVARAMRPVGRRLGPRRVDTVLRPVERTAKGLLFGCRMCGQCVLHDTGMTCPMTCPKNLRNGPCGGVRQDGACEVDADSPCIWVEAWARAARMPLHGDAIRQFQPPLDRRLAGSASWTGEIACEAGPSAGSR
jgi:hypothetical protein